MKTRFNSSSSPPKRSLGAFIPRVRSNSASHPLPNRRFFLGKAHLSYRFEYPDAVLEIQGNRGTITLAANTEELALFRARLVFHHMREVTIRHKNLQYLIEFTVDPKHNRNLHRKARRVAKLPLTHQQFARFDLPHKYMALLCAILTGCKTQIGDQDRLLEKLESVREKMLNLGIVPEKNSFCEYDIAVSNVLENRDLAPTRSML